MKLLTKPCETTSLTPWPFPSFAAAPSKPILWCVLHQLFNPFFLCTNKQNVLFSAVVKFCCMVCEETGDVLLFVASAPSTPWTVRRIQLHRTPLKLLYRTCSIQEMSSSLRRFLYKQNYAHIRQSLDVEIATISFPNAV